MSPQLFLLINLGLLLFFYAFSLLLARYFIRSSELFILKTTYNRQATEFTLEPHYPWYLAIGRHLLLLLIIWLLIWQIDVTALTSALLIQVLLLTAAVLFASIMAALFWHMTSYRIDRAFHKRRDELAKGKRICVLKTHGPLNESRYLLISKLLYFFGGIFLLTGTAIWLNNFFGPF